MQLFYFVSAIVGMEERHLLLTEPMCLKVVVETTNDIVGTFTTLPYLVREEINLPWQDLTVHYKHTALSWYKKINGSWLEYVRIAEGFFYIIMMDIVSGCV